MYYIIMSTYITYLINKSCLDLVVQPSNHLIHLLNHVKITYSLTFNLVVKSKHDMFIKQL